MISKPPPPRYPAGTRVKVRQHVRVGHRRWTTEIGGVVEDEGQRPIGGMEMGGKSLYCRQNTLRLRHDDGEITVVALDEATEVQESTAAAK